jgi:hypothetical protein
VFLIYCTNAENAQSFRAEMNRHKQYARYRHALPNQLRMKSKHASFDKSGAWPTQVNFQP